MTTYSLGARSLARLDGVHPDLANVVKRAIQISTRDFTVVEGVRSQQAMWDNWGKGRSAATCKANGVPVECAKPLEAKVTWLKDPLKSNHRTIDGFGRAVDLAPWVDGTIGWNDKAGFDEIYRAMMAAASEIGVHLRSGRDWNGNGHLDETGETDRPHFELTAGGNT